MLPIFNQQAIDTTLVPKNRISKKNQNPTQIFKYKKLIPRTPWYLQNLIPEQHWS
jgi:hypothetical protein